MSKNLRHPELSEKNPYWIERHRYYELKHFCLQYPLWKKEYDIIDGASKRGGDLGTVIQISGYGDPTAKAAEAMIYLSTRMDMVKKAAADSDELLAKYLVIGITEGWSYDVLKARLEIPCGKDTYYDRYRKFFWLLDKIRA
ncbi:hypothetical protein [Acutalibacter sp. JLR.KK004]|uniref:hypothetical protein n=1 Tax=Acutalibacter sp. JLR.KK004 TaxID=3112622 RepID=UPI002FF36E65